MKILETYETEQIPDIKAGALHSNNEGAQRLRSNLIKDWGDASGIVPANRIERRLMKKFANKPLAGKNATQRRKIFIDSLRNE